MIPLHADESVCDLARGGLRLIQSLNGFRFGEDTVLLADYAARQPAVRQSAARGNRRCRVADLGAGNGASSLLFTARHPNASVLAVEMDAHSLSLIERNRRLNNLQDRLEILDSDYSRWTIELPALPDGACLGGSFDMVIANPPYGVANGGPAGDARLRNARQEHTMSLDDLIRAAALLLRPHGRLVLIHRASRLTDVLTVMRQYQIEPKSLRLVVSAEGKPASRFLVTGVRQARRGSLDVEPVLLIRDRQHRLTEEVHQIYQNEPLLPENVLVAGLEQIDKVWSPDEPTDVRPAQS